MGKFTSRQMLTIPEFKDPKSLVKTLGKDSIQSASKSPAAEFLVKVLSAASPNQLLDFWWEMLIVTHATLLLKKSQEKSRRGRN